MPSAVNRNPGTGRRAARIAATEERILRAAADLFVARGYAGTTLADVADAADVAARTVYVRFATKVALFRRTLGVATVGDTAPVDVRGRDWFLASLGAPTLPERITALASGSRAIMARAGDLLAVSYEAARSEPEIAAAAQAGHEYTYRSFRDFWTHAADDGLLPAGADVDWLADTTFLALNAETYLVMTRVQGWTLDAYETWAATTLTRLAAVSATAPLL